MVFLESRLVKSLLLTSMLASSLAGLRMSMGWALACWKQRRSSKERLAKSDPLVFMLLDRFWMMKRLCGGNVLLPRSSAFSSSSLPCAVSCLLAALIYALGMSSASFGYQWDYLGHIPVPSSACGSCQRPFPLLGCH